MITETIRFKRVVRLSKEGFWILLGQIMLVLGTIIGVRVITEILGPESYGELALGMTVVILINKILLAPLSNGAARFYAPAAEKNDLTSYVCALKNILIFLISVIIMFGVLIATVFLSFDQMQWIPLVIAAFIFAILSGFNGVLNSVQNAARQRAIVALHQGSEPWARFTCAAGLVFFFGRESTLAMLGYSFAASIIILSQLFFFRKIIPEKAIKSFQIKNWQHEITKFSLPFAVWGIFTWAQFASSRWGLEFYTTTREVGLFSALFQIGYYPISLATTLMCTFLGPIFYQRAGDGADSLRNSGVDNLGWRLAGFCLIMTGLAFSVGMLFHKQIFALFVSNEFASISHLLPWMIFAGGLFAAAHIVSFNIRIRMKPQILKKAKIISSLVGIIFNLAGAYWYGTRGVVMAMCIFSLLHFIWVARLAKNINENLPVVNNI